MSTTDNTTDDPSKIINLSERRKKAEKTNSLPTSNSFWSKRKNNVSLIMAERALKKIEPAKIMLKFMHKQFLRPWTMYGDSEHMWAVFALNQTNMPLSLGLVFNEDVCQIQISASYEKNDGKRVNPIPTDNPWAVLHHAETVTVNEVHTKLGPRASDYFYWFIQAYRQTLEHLAEEFHFYAEVKNRSLIPPELLERHTPKKALICG